MELLDLHRLYSSEGKSIPDIAKMLGVGYSVARRMLITAGVELRSRADGIRSSSEKLGKHMIGKKREFSENWKANMAAARRKHVDLTAKGTSKKTGGYVVITRGANKHRTEHAVIMEQKIGRRLMPDEVVHHMDGNKHNNSIDNLVIMTRAEHTSMHRNERKGDKHGIS